MSHYIPLEIQAEIMKRLPVKSLIRFESVSKAWKSVIHSSKFINDYNACHPQQHSLFVTCRDKNRKEKHVFIVDDDTFPLRKLSNTIPSSVNLLGVNLYTEDIFGSSQGLFCFYGHMDDHLIMAVIWNPSIRKSVDIVVSSNFDRSMHKIVVGFGVCPRTFDPKLVKITYITTVDPMYNNYKPTQVEVFTLSSGAWKSRSINLPRESIWFLRNSNVELDGFIYWLAKDVDELHKMIMSFDMRSENFIEISLPDSLVDCAYSRLFISKRMESLVVLENAFARKQAYYNVWVMEGVQKSFTKLFTIEVPGARITRVLGFRKSGEPIIAMDKNGSDSNELGAYLYEPNSRQISDIEIFGPHLCLASSYTDTLLLLDR